MKSRILTALATGLLACGDDGGGEPAPHDESKRCEAQSNEAGDALRAAIQSFDRSCATDDDCTTVWLHSACYSSCSELLSKTGEAQLAQASEAQASTVCKGFAEAGCVALAPPCPAPPAVKCQANVCGNVTR